MTRRLATAALTLVVLAAPATAQDSSRRALRVQRQQLPARPGARGGGRAAGARALDEANAPLRQQVQLAFRNRVRQELNLDQPKMRRLNQTEQGFNKQRNELLQTERQTRLALLAAMQDSAGPDQPKIDQYINQLTQVQRKRAELVEAEQKELSSFLTPLQRAQYLSLKERLNRRLQDLNQAGRGAAPPPSGPPPEPPAPDR